jgi:hypothetical protein
MNLSLLLNGHGVAFVVIFPLLTNEISIALIVILLLLTHRMDYFVVTLPLVANGTSIAVVMNLSPKFRILVGIPQNSEFCRKLL